jgi:Trehalose and maltose hydrolases (possible phosphorylases)
MRTYFRDKQVHISADVAYAFWQYYTLTGDASIWQQGGAEVVFECARFFASLLYYRPEFQRYEVLDVTGPDEYHERVHNNAFTNWMVAHTLEVCLQVADLVREQYPQTDSAIFGGTKAREDLELIRQMSEKIYRPETAAREGVIPQFDGYFALEDVTMQDLLSRRLDPHEYLGGGNGLATTTQIIKQADVILGLFLLGDHFSLESKRANWDYYEPRCENGSSLSACSYSMIAAQSGRVDWAYQYFMKTATIDITGEGKQYVGPLYIGGTHPAANGGAWMAAVFGLCGFHCDETTMHLNPHLPETWQQVDFPVKFKGQSLRLSVSPHLIRITLDRPLTCALTLEMGGTLYAIEAGLEIAW